MDRQPDTIIDVRQLTAAYGREVILDGVDFQVRRGEVVAVMGGSGCGKSTLLKVMIGTLPPRTGTLHLFGHRVEPGDDELRRQLCRKFGILYQFGALFGGMTVAENVALPLEEYTQLPPAAIAAIVAAKLEQVGLGGCQELYPAELSGGMRKRAGLARAMALDPELLFFDEPSSGLDPVIAADLDALILGLKKEGATTMVVVTHDLDSAFAIADRMVLLDRDRRGILAAGTPAEFRGERLRRWPQAVIDFFDRKGMGRWEDVHRTPAVAAFPPLTEEIPT